jgi:AraC-like DNA-binding protein
MFSESNGGNSFSSDHFFIEKLTFGQIASHQPQSAGWIMDFALKGTVVINGIELSKTEWKLSSLNEEKRVIKYTGNVPGSFLSLSIHENPYADSLNNLCRGFISTEMAYPLLQIISLLLEGFRDPENDIKFKCYVQLLLIQLDNEEDCKCPFDFEELLTIDRVIRGLPDIVDHFPKPSTLFEITGIKKSKFEKACLAIYGLSPQKIIQHQKMTKAFNAILIDRMEISRASSKFGYRYSPNFITAFRNHFALTPFEAVHLYQQ